MITNMVFNTAQTGTSLGLRSSFRHSYRQTNIPHDTPMSLQWSVHQDMDPMPIAYGQVNYWAFASRVQDLLKLERQHRERMAAVSLDPAAQKLLNALDQETSVKWDDIPDKADGDWSEASRAAALLAGANLCEVSPTRIRLSEYGDKLLAEESTQAAEAIPEVAG